MLQIHFANRLETLTLQLLARLRADGETDPLAPAQVIVPSAAMRRHLTLRAADAQGVCANVEFTFLAQWLWQQIGRVLQGVQAESPFSPEVMAWRVYAAFGDDDFVAAHPRLAAYLAEADPVMRLDLARRSAGLLEQYITYRADWLARWEAGEPADLGAVDDSARADEAWQAALWRRIVAELALKQDPAQQLIGVLEGPDGPALAAAAGLPASAHVFALPAMPPQYIRLLQALGRCMQLQVYVLNPCREYWFEVIDRRRLAHLAARGQEALHEEGNHLLAAWGRQTQAQIDLLVEAAGEQMVDDAMFNPAPGGTLLAEVQNAVLDLVELPPAGVAADRSIEVHRCHSLTRQLEVLQDQLLAMFTDPSLPGLHPSDVLVVTPDLDTAAPLIDAVFGTAPPERQLPFAITGRPRSRINRCARAMLELLALVGSRLPASGLHGLLQQPVVARRFALDAAALDQVQQDLAEAGVRWALDAAHRGSFGVPAQAQHTLDDGLARLFLGYALPTQAHQPFAGRLPAGDVEGAAADTLGAFWRYAQALGQLHRRCRQPHTPAGWQAVLQQAMDDFIAPADHELEDLRELRQAIQGLADAMNRGGLGDPGATPLPLAVLRHALEQALDDPARGGVPGGGITFSSMSSLRGLPYRVICAIGLDDGAFPSTPRESEFDLMALRPRRGDRQRRFDERNLFLDLLLAARDRLLLAYTGRSVRDNSELPPSVLVAELLDTLAPAVKEGRQALLVAHALQPFSPENFHPDSDARQRSFHREYAEALARQAAQPAAPAGTWAEQPLPDDDADDDAAPALPAAPLFARPLPPPGDEWRQVSIGQLTEFFRHPSRALLRRRLGLDLPRAADELQDDEPFVADRAGRQALAERLLPLLLDPATADTLDDARLQALAAAGTEYPPGALGEQQRNAELARLQQFAAQVREALQVPPLPALHGQLPLDLAGEAWQLSGSWADLRPDGLVRWRYDDTRPVDYLQAWLPHLLLNVARPGSVSRFISRDGSFTLRPVDHAPRHLHTLLNLYRQGLQQPLHFFAKTSWAQATGAARSQVEATWRTGPRRPYAEEADAAHRLALRGLPDPLDEAFEQVAEAVYRPLLDHLDDARL